VGTHLDAFFNKLCEHLQNKNLHPYQIASFIHYGISKIHPRADGNGRLARCFMNIYLMQKGLPPLRVLEDAEYTALFEEEDFEKAFSNYLHNSNIKIAEKLADGTLPSELLYGYWTPRANDLASFLERLLFG
jgi:Fic family protein